MTTDPRLAQAIAELKGEDQDHVFEALRLVAEEFGWELSKRDPGPLCIFCEDEGYTDSKGRVPCTHCVADPCKAAHPSTPQGWFKLAGIIEPDAEIGEIKDSYRRLALVRRVPGE